MKPTEQQELILNYDGPSVVIAAPGSGKTFVLSQKIKANLKGLLEHQGIIAISYTNKASNELKRRSLSNGENPKSSFFGTIDKFNLSEIIVPFAKHLFGIPSNPITIVKFTSLSKADQSKIAWVDRDLTLGMLGDEQLDQLKKNYLNGIIFIETIGVFANYVFTNSAACRNYINARYKYIYTDEYQDCGHEQHELFLKIKQLGAIAVAVGDLNQSIFEFSGKNSKYMEALTKNDDFKFFVLDKNHRCHPSIINYSNYLLNTRTELIAVEQNHIIFCRIEGAEKEIAKWIDDKLEVFKKGFKVTSNSEVAILTKSTKTADLLNTHLQTPHRLIASNDLDSSMYAWSSIFSALLHFVFDHNYQFADAIEVFTSYDRLDVKQLRLLGEFKSNLERLRFEEEPDPVEIKEVLLAIANVIANSSANRDSVDLLDEVLADPLALNSYRSVTSSEVNILTLHKSKGLEYDLIIHLDLYKWILPQLGPGPGNDWNNPIYSNKSQDLNLHYVGLTRARKGCILVSSTQRTNSKNEIKKAEDSEFLWLENIKDLRYKPKGEDNT